jgi:alpha-glucosidase
MQWTGNPNAGFCPPGQLPWLPVNPNYAQGINVADQMKDPGSILNYYRDLLQVRRGLPALISGDYQEILAGSKELLAFTRHDPHSDQKCLVALNFSDQSQSLAHSGVTSVTKRVFSSQERGTRLQPAQDLRLAPYEVWIGVFERSK